MGMRGPKPKPATIHLVNGNPSKKNVASLLAGIKTRPVGLPDCPVELNDDAHAEWNRLGPLLEQLGLISHLDMTAFALYCSAWGDYLMACRKLNELGADQHVMTTDTGYQQQSPWFTLKLRAAEAVNKFKQEFGLSPADWNRVEASPQGDLFGDDKHSGKKTDYFSKS